MESIREITVEEKKLLELLISRSLMPFPKNWDKKLLVMPMEDGEMGGLYLYPQGEINTKRQFGMQISEIQFKDQDGIDVIASLYIDKEGNLFELDIWKTDFSKLIKITGAK